MKSTVGRKIGVAFLAIMLLMGAMVGITFRGFDKVISSLDDMEREAVKRGASGNLRSSITQLLMAGNDYIITEKQYYQREYDRLSTRVDNLYEQFLQLSPTDEEQQLLVGIKQDLDSVRSYLAQIFVIQHPRQSPKAWALMETMDYRFGDDVNRKTTEIFDGISRRIEQHRRLAAADKENASNSIYGITFLGILISLVVSYLTVQRISKPIVTVTKAANGIANGDYSQRPVVKTHDEVAVLAESFCRMAESIQQSQRALEESKRLTEAIVATVPSGLLVFDSDGKILSMNNSYCNIFGLARDVLIGEYVEPVFKESGISEECRKHILAREPVRDIECTYSDPTKGTRILNLTLFPIRLTDRESLLVVEDITRRKLSEQIVVDNEKRFRALIENSSDGLSIISADGTLLYESPASSRIVGYAHGELLNKNVFALIHPDDSPSVMVLFTQLLKEPSTVMRAELRVQHKDGSWRWIEAAATNCLNDPTIGGVVINFRDITEHKRAEEVLRQSEEKFSKAFHSSPDSVTISTIPHGKLIEINEGFTRIVGYSREEAIGRTTGELNIWANPEDRQRFLKTVQEQGFVRNFEFNLLTKSGEIRLCQVSGDIIELEGQRSLLAIAKDITELKQAEQELQKLSRVVQQTADIVFVTDRNGVIDYVNPAFEETTGYSREEVMGKTPGIFKSGEHPQSFYERLWKTILDGLPFRSILINRKKDGTVFFEQKTITPLREQDGAITHFVSTGKDVTEQIKAVELLRKSEEKQRLVLSNMQEIVYMVSGQDGNLLSGTVEFVNDQVEAILGYAAKDFVTNPRLWLESLHPEDIAVVQKSTERLLAEKEPHTRTYRIKHKHTGEYRWMEDHVVPRVTAVDNKVIGIFGVARDITDRKQAEDIARTYSERLEILSKQLLEIQENERRVIARELHDEVGQALTSLKILLDMSTKANVDNAKQNLKDALGITSDLIGRIRDISLDLRPHMLDDLGLVPAMRWHLLHHTEKVGIKAHFAAEPEEIHVSPEIGTTCFRVAQEALTNVLKHSKAKSVEVQLMKRGANLELAIRDDGGGFGVESASRRAAAGKSFGLLGMQERVRLAGGALIIRSEQGRGSEIQATFPNAFAPSPTNNERSAE